MAAGDGVPLSRVDPARLGAWLRDVAHNAAWPLSLMSRATLALRQRRLLDQALTFGHRRYAVGCDIHMWVEVRERGVAAGDRRLRDAERRGDQAAYDRLAPWGPWRLCRSIAPWKCDWCDGAGRRNYVEGPGAGQPIAGEPACPNCAGTGEVTGAFHERHYWTFGMRAGVRSDRYPPIAKPRGWPKDLNPELGNFLGALDALREEREDASDEERDALYAKADALYDAWWNQSGPPYGNRIAGPGDHSASWLTLAELLAYFDAPMDTQHQGCVTADAYERWRAAGGGKPHTWAGGIGGPVRVDHEEADRRLAAGDRHSWYTVVEWGGTARDDAGVFVADFLPALVATAPCGPDSLRIVFNFDS